MILPLNWLSTPNSAEMVKRCRRSSGAAGAAAPWNDSRVASLHTTSTRSPGRRFDRTLASVASSRRREYLGAFRAAEGDHPRRRVPAGDGHGGDALRSDQPARAARRRGDAAGERAIDRRFAGRLGPDGGAVGVRHRDDVADPYLVESLDRDRDVRDHQVALFGPYGQHALEVIDGGDGAAQGDLFEHDVAGLGGSQCGRQDEAGNRGDGRLVLDIRITPDRPRGAAGVRRGGAAVASRFNCRAGRRCEAAQLRAIACILEHLRRLARVAVVRSAIRRRVGGQDTRRAALRACAGRAEALPYAQSKTR